MIDMSYRIAGIAALAYLLGVTPGSSLMSQTDTAARRGSVERIKVHGRSLEGNLSGDSADRDVSIYLPSTYKTESRRRYPVIYFLHGFTDSDSKWYGFEKHWINAPAVFDRALANPEVAEMIVVTPNAFTRYQGSMYSNSVTTGDWESFIAKELVSFVDSHYRTMAGAASRGLAGHSMGGYGTLRIGMKYPDVFSALYALSPCCLAPSSYMQAGAERFAKAESIRDPSEVPQADFGTKAAMASAAAWSPNPNRSPLFYDLPWRNGEFQPAIAAKWSANAPLATVDQNIPNLRRLTAIAFDAGTKDTGIAATVKTLDGILNDYKIAHFYEIYEGTHTDRIAERIETKTMPFFSKNLKGDRQGR
jgi:enterochelin esterase-like enzyme